MTNKVIVLDFGSQYTQLIARRLRELNIYCEIYPYNKLSTDLTGIGAVILSGSPFSVLDKNALYFDLKQVIDKVPVLAICYGAQLTAHQLGGKVGKSEKREYGKATLQTVKNDLLFEGISNDSQVWMSHGDTIKEIPNQFEIIGSTKDIPVAAFKSNDDENEKPFYCLQFHPEVTHSLEGGKILSNFIYKIAQLESNWSPRSFVENTVEELRHQLNDDRVVMGLSGGVDSTVAATLIHKAIGKNLFCVFIDNGLLRKDEFESVLESYKGMGLNIIGVKANNHFLKELEGVSDPEAKRKIIGRVFIEVFKEEANKITDVKWLGQGTIYPDVIESVSVSGPSVTIKSHHNVGGLPKELGFNLVEPLRMLFKDEVRKVGAELRISNNLIGRHPFPGPGLAIRVLGEITREKVRLCQEADAIYINKLKQHNLYDKVWQAGAILLPVQSVGVMGDERTYESTIALRCVNSSDGMTAEWSRLPHEFLAEVSSEIINQVKGINRVVYDISTKPPATIEWE